jgi:DNA (cytosine-5)-methyltransferase 1
MKHLALFNGIGGFQLAAHWMGWKNIASCEIVKVLNQVTKYYYPDCIQHEDIKTTDFTIYRGQIDILTGGFPCQPYSSSGKRLGKEDERHLWPEMLRAIGEVSPRIIVGENVYGLVNWNGGMVFDEVQADLEAKGYQVAPIILPACAVNAPHRRDRVWFVAYSDKCSKKPSRTSRRIVGKGSNNNDESQEWREQTEQYIGCSDVLQVDTNTSNTRVESLRKREDSIHGLEPITDTERIRKQRQRWTEGQLRSKENEEWKASWSYDDGRWPTQSPVRSGDDGLPNGLDGFTISTWREEQIKAYGNAIVPQVALEIFRAINKTLDVR